MRTLHALSLAAIGLLALALPQADAAEAHAAPLAMHDSPQLEDSISRSSLLLGRHMDSWEAMLRADLTPHKIRVDPLDSVPVQRQHRQREQAA